MGINFEEFMNIARSAHAWDIIECWDLNAFNEYIEEFGPMIKAQAKELCRFTKAVTEEELAAAEFYGKW